jgi:hypothetical protein
VRGASKIWKQSHNQDSSNACRKLRHTPFYVHVYSAAAACHLPGLAYMQQLVLCSKQPPSGLINNHCMDPRCRSVLNSWGSGGAPGQLRTKGVTRDGLFKIHMGLAGVGTPDNTYAGAPTRRQQQRPG